MSFDFEKFADKIENELQGNCIGYAFVVSYKDQWRIKRAGGKARCLQDPIQRDMSTDEQFNIASVSKTITAAALLKVLHQRTGVSLSSSFAPFLPNHWTVHNSIRNTSFQDLLAHRAGFRFQNGVSYAALKENMAQGVRMADIGVREYNNANYGLMRMLIPQLANYTILQADRNVSGSAEVVIDKTQEGLYAAFYMDYVRKELFAKMGLPALQCKPLPFGSALCYQFPPEPFKSGGNFGDMTLTNASRGWVMSAAQMAKFVRKLHFSEEALPLSLSERMKTDLLGYDDGHSGQTPVEKIRYCGKNGNYPGSRNPGELNSLILVFDNGVQVALIINSQLQGRGMVAIIRDAFDDAYAMKKIAVKDIKR